MKCVHMQKRLLGKILVTHQTGPEGKEVKRLYIEEGSDIQKEYYLSLSIRPCDFSCYSDGFRRRRYGY